MMRQDAGNVRPTLAWFVFPLVPAVLGRTYHDTFNLAFSRSSGPDPRDWTWLGWVLLLGPLLGYGFLAGATTLLEDDPLRRGIRSWVSRRGVWVAVGPWAGFLVLAGLYFLLVSTISLVNWLLPRSREWPSPLPTDLAGRWWGGVVWWALVVGGVGTLAYGWLVVAVAAVLRARAMGRCRRVIERGVAGALGFTGSLFGGFWAITELWRSYFFDKTIVPIALAALVLTAAGGCSGPLTYGEQRRRELFSAMLMAWLLGLALAWRWWSRPRSSG